METPTNNLILASVSKTDAQHNDENSLLDFKGIFR
jgi:hypothetical protein